MKILGKKLKEKREEKKKGKQEYLFCKILWAWGEEKRTAGGKNRKKRHEIAFFQIKKQKKFYLFGAKKLISLGWAGMIEMHNICPIALA